MCFADGREGNSQTSETRKIYYDGWLFAKRTKEDKEEGRQGSQNRGMGGFLFMFSLQANTRLGFVAGWGTPWLLPVVALVHDTRKRGSVVACMIQKRGGSRERWRCFRMPHVLGHRVTTAIRFSIPWRRSCRGLWVSALAAALSPSSGADALVSSVLVPVFCFFVCDMRVMVRRQQQPQQQRQEIFPFA